MSRGEKPVSKGHILHGSIYITPLNDRIIEMGNKLAVVKVKDGGGGHGEGSGCDYKDVAWEMLVLME